MSLIDDINALPTSVTENATNHLNHHTTIHAAVKDHTPRLYNAEQSAVRAENKVDEYTPRLDALEAMNGVTPESPVDGQTASIILQEDSLTRKALGQSYFSRDLGSEFFEAPPQPSFSIRDPEHVWDGDGRTIADFIAEKFDPLMSEHAGLVTRTVLGKDSSGTYDIIEYDINPDGATQTILLQTGVHGRETVPVYSMYRFMHYLLNEPDIHPDIRYLRDTVRIKLIPNMGVWAGSQQPKVYSNSNDQNINRNFPVNREYLPMTGVISGRGPAPLSEAESVITMDWYKANLNAAFAIDFHTDYSFYGQSASNGKDVWVVRPAFGGVWAQAVDPIVGRMADRVREKHGREPVVVIDEGANTSSVTKYVMEVLGIPRMTLEHSETRFGGSFGGHEDIQHELTHMVNFVAGLARQRLRDKLNAEKQVDYNRIARMKRVFNFYSDQANLNWSLPTLESKIDQMVADNPEYAQVTNLGADQSGTYQVRSLTLTPKYYRRTIALIGGLQSNFGVDTMLLYQLAYMLCYESQDYGLGGIRSDIRLIIIPTINPWGYNDQYVDLETVRLGVGAGDTIQKTSTNSAGERVSRAFTTSTQAEVIILRDLMTTNVGVWDAVIGLRDTSTQSIPIAVNYATGANQDMAKIALQLGESVTRHHPRLGGSGVSEVEENLSVVNSDFHEYATSVGHNNTLQIMLTAYGFSDGVNELRSLNRPTALAHMSYLLDLVDALRDVI